MHISPATFGRIAAIATCLVVASHETARADLSACGEIDVQPEATCVVVPPSAQCEAMCEPITVRAACSAKLAVDCGAQCDELPSVDCQASCQAGCKADCMVDPGKFECAIDCRAECNGECEATCAANSDKANCMASCSGACSVGCDKQCDVELPSVDCDAQCKASCQGSCEVKTNLDCQVQCQSKGYARCEADLQGGCVASCQTNKGALFCDGDFVDTNKIDECVAALKAILNAKVTASSSGSAECAQGSCMAEGEASVSSDCSVSHVGSGDSSGTSVFGLMSLCGVLLFFRRRR